MVIHADGLGIDHHAESPPQFSRPGFDRFRCVIQIPALDVQMPGICSAQACF